MQMTIDFRPALRADVECIVEMLADDPLGTKRENAVKPLPKSYYDAFEHIVEDPNNELVVAECEGIVVGVLQLTYIPYLTYQGSWRALIEGVRVHKDYRSKGIGKELFTWAIEKARLKPCKIVQLTSDKGRQRQFVFMKASDSERHTRGLNSGFKKAKHHHRIQVVLIISCDFRAIFGFVSVGHILRVLFHWSFAIGGWSAPIPASWSALFVAAAMCVWAIRPGGKVKRNFFRRMFMRL